MGINPSINGLMDQWVGGWVGEGWGFKVKFGFWNVRDLLERR